MALTARAGAQFGPQTQRVKTGHEIDPGGELITVIEGRALINIQTRQVTFAVDG